MRIHAEPTIDDLLSDPLTLSLMAADGVDPAELRSMLRLAARRLEAQRHPVEPRTSWPDHGDLLRDCIHSGAASAPHRHGTTMHRPAASRAQRSW